MARYKLNNDGSVYYDPNDEGPDQASADQIAQYQASQGGSTSTAPTSTEAPEQDLQSSSELAQPGSTTTVQPLEDKMLALNEQQYAGSGGIASPYTPPNGNTGINGGAIGAGTQVQPATGTAPTAAPTGSSAVPEGFTAEKWNDPNKHDPKYDAGHMLASGKSVEEIGAYIQQTYPGYKYLGGDKIQGPDGYIYDFAYGHDAGINRPEWEQVGGGPSGSQSGSVSGGQQGPVGSYASSGGFDASLGGNPFGSGPVADAIMRLLGRGEGGTENDPNIAASTAAFRGEVERQGRRSRNAMAERMAAEGLNYGGSGSGAFDSAIQSELEGEGMKVGQFRANEVLQEIAAKRQDVINALQLAQGQEKLGLEQYLAQLNEQLQRAQMAQQNNQWYDQFTYGMARDNADRDAAMAKYLQ